MCETYSMEHGKMLHAKHWKFLAELLTSINLFDTYVLGCVLSSFSFCGYKKTYFKGLYSQQLCRIHAVSAFTQPD